MAQGRYEPGSQVFREMKPALERGILVVGDDGAHAVFTNKSNAASLAVAVSHGEINRGRILQVTMDRASREPVNFSAGIEIERDGRPMPTQPGRATFFAVPLSITKQECDTLVPEMREDGKVVDAAKATIGKCTRELTQVLVPSA